MTKFAQTFIVPPSLAIAEGAATPDPGGVAASGCMVWSSTLGALVRWNGSAWGSLSGAGSFANTQLSVTAAADQQNWAISGRTAYTTLNCDTADSSFVGGIAGGTAGDVLIILNVSASGLLWIISEDAGSTAANRFSLNRSGVFILPGESVTLVYNAALSRWVETAVSLDVFQPDDKTLLILPNATTSVVSLGLGATSNTATLSTIAPSATPTNDFAEGPATQITNATANGSSDVRANTLNFMTGATANRQGIFFNARVRFPALGATGSVMVGMTASTAAITTQARLTNNTFGIAAHGGETSLRAYTRNASTLADVDLGANFPAGNATAAYEAVFLAKPGFNLRYMVRRLDSEFRAQGNFASSLIANTQALGPRIGITVGATATANTAQFARILARSVS